MEILVAEDKVKMVEILLLVRSLQQVEAEVDMKVVEMVHLEAPVELLQFMEVVLDLEYQDKEIMVVLVAGEEKMGPEDQLPVDQPFLIQ